MRPALIVILGALLCSVLQASFSPKLDLIQPRGAQRGAEVTLRLRGDRLDDPRELLFHRPGIEFIEFTTPDAEEKERGKRLGARIRVAADAPLGEHPVRLRTTGGVSYLRSLWVGPYATVAETEPNDGFAKPQRVEPGHTVEGVAKREDEDFYAVTLKKGERLSAEAEAMRLGQTFFDVHLSILGPDRFEVASCDDAPLLRTDAFCSIIAPEDGEYRVVVREAAYEGGDSSRYRLHLGDFPRPSAVFPTGARPGEEVALRFTGDPAGALTRTLAIPADASGRFPVFAGHDGATAPSPNWIQVSELAHTAEAEPNDRRDEATELPELPAAAHGILEEAEDQDWFRFRAKKDQRLEIRVLGRELRSPIDAVIHLREAGGKYLEGNDDQGGPDPAISWRCPADGEYLVVVREKLDRSGPDFTYRLEIEPRRPAIAASLPVVERNNSQARKMICIPRGNRYATEITLNRSNVSCDAEFTASSLPDGVSLHVPDITRSLNSVPVVFEAAADAPVAGGYHEFRVRATGEKAPDISGPLKEEIHLIEINNQGAYHSVRSEKIAVAVIDEAPFSLALETPAAPLVPRGNMKLGIRADRREGFNAPIKLHLIWKPPGIGARNTDRLDGGKDAAEYEISASPDARPGTWRVAILGEAETDQGTVFASTGLTPVEVAEPWVTASIDLGATEQGRDVPVVCKLDVAREFEGNAKAELVGLPHGAKTEPLEFTHDTAELSFPVEVAKDARVGKHGGLFLRVHVPHAGTRVLHQTGHGGTLRIDKPRENVAEKDEGEQKEKAPEKEPLSRLEQLRRQAKSD